MSRKTTTYMMGLGLFAALGLGLGDGLTLTGCGIDEPPCAFVCGPSGECPDDYSCLPDGYCHLHGKAGTCSFSDAAPVADMHVAVDAGDGSTPPDLASFDLESTDAAQTDLSATPDMTASLPDMTAPPDLTTPPPDLTPTDL